VVTFRSSRRNGYRGGRGRCRQPGAVPSPRVCALLDGSFGPVWPEAHAHSLSVCDCRHGWRLRR